MTADQIVRASPFPDIAIPDIDLWSLLFERCDWPYPTEKDVQTGHRLTYTQVRRRALAFGRRLQRQWSWAPGDVLAVLSPNSIEMPAVIWGTLSVGGVVCPLHSGYCVEELMHPLRDVRPRVLVAGSAQAGVALDAAHRAGMPPTDVVILDELATELSQRDLDITLDAPHVAPVAHPAQDLAFVVFSSGTTGLPKGVMLSHTNMVANLLQVTTVDDGVMAWNRGFRGEGDRMLALLPFFHIYGLTFLLNQTVYLGLSTFVVRRFQLDTFCSTVQEQKITYACVVPPIILELVSDPRVAQYDLSSLRMMVSGAAPLATELIHTLADKLNLRVRRGYGLSECSPCTHIQTWSEATTHVGSVGSLMPNMMARYSPIDDCPDRSKEILVKGPSVFLGYLDNPSANAESLTEDGYYQTGDVGYEDGDGCLHITGRVKELIKYNGFQVAPAELEAILLRHPAVADVAVGGIKSGVTGTELPRAYVVVTTGSDADPSTEDDIIRFVRDQVAGYKQLRGGVCFVDAIPRNPSGKILRREVQKLNGRSRDGW